MLLRIAHLVGTGALDPRVDLTWVCYDCEEIEAARNGLGRLARERPGRACRRSRRPARADRRADRGRLPGHAAGRGATSRACGRTAPGRGWAPTPSTPRRRCWTRLAAYEAREVDVDGLTYREGLNAVAISGGVAGNVVPDACAITVNYRFAPDRSEAEALAHVREVFAGYRARR